MISYSSGSRQTGRQHLPNLQNPQSSPSPPPISRRDIFVFREIAVSEALSNLEIEPEWCSEAVLSSISETTMPGDTQAAEPILLRSVEPVAEPLAANFSDSDATPKNDPVPVKPARSMSKSRSETKTSRPKKSPPSAKAMSLFTAFRSRRVRIVATVVSVLFVCGLIALNWKSGSSNSGDELTELDLSEFNSTSGFDEPHIGNTPEPQPLEDISDTESIPKTDRFSRAESGPRLPPLRLVTHADHTTLRGSSVSGFVPTSASSSGSRGAVLTGQIEFEAAPRSTETPARPSRNLGLR